MTVPVPPRIVGAHLPRRGADSASLRLPPDLLEQAVRRLGWLALLIGVLMVASVAFNTLMHLVRTDVPLPLGSVVARLVGAAAGAGMWLAARSKRLSPETKTQLGLGYEVVGAATIIAFELTMMPELGVPFGAIPTAALWVVLFQLIVPAAPLRGLVAALCAASMVPLTTWAMSHVASFDVAQASHPLRYGLAYGAALIAWLAAHAIYQLGRAVTEARMLGSYRLERLLGRGGMGEVWVGQHAMLKRPAAIKLIAPEKLGATDSASRATALRRFEREARSTAELRSPHTVTLYDYGVTPEGTFYYVMELLDGIDLDTLVVKHGPMPPERVVYLLEQLCHSLIDAHERGLVHRDIKPANLVLCRLGPDVDVIKVLDFGLVKSLQEDQESAPQLSREGVITGTPAFLPPEVALGTSRADPRSDLYMVGCVAYWLLTGEQVFAGESPIALISSHIHTAPTPVAERCEAELPAELADAVMQCLAKDPQERPDSARALRRRLRAVPLDQPWTDEQARAWWQALDRRAEDG